MATSKIPMTGKTITVAISNATTNQYGHVSLGINHLTCEVIYVQVTSPSSPMLIATPIAVTGTGSYYAIVTELYATTTTPYANKSVSLEVCYRRY